MPDVRQLLETLLDAGVGAASTVWPRSETTREVRRLVQEGYTAGGGLEMLFSVSFDPDQVEAGLAALNAAGFPLRDQRAATACCTIAARIRLTPYHLHMAVARLQRLLAPHGGFAVPLGPAHGPSALHLHATPGRGIESSWVS